MRPTPSSTRKSSAFGVFADDVRDGLQRQPKSLPSKYFYDERGDALFQRIMAMPEYYLTRCEQEIFEARHQDILQAISARPFELVELGAGDGAKTMILLRHFLEEGVEFEYLPVDISGSVLALLRKKLRRHLPQLRVRPLQGDYMRMIERINLEDAMPKVILFLGSNIGNLEREAAVAFLRRLAAHMKSGDYLFLGVDLKKDPALIRAAYDDPAGITEAFNKNLLRRINRELGGQFDLDSFLHWARYDPESGSARSYLVSRRAQRVGLERLDLEIPFEAWEPIRVELSQKYHLREVDDMAAACGLEVRQHFTDRRRYFVDTLWQKP